jgi:fatty acid desaturase
LFLVGDNWLTLGIAVLLGLVFTHVVFLGHEAGHQQVFGSRRANLAVGLAVGNMLTGLSFGWWVPKHNAHHAYPNQIGLDPDIGLEIDTPVNAQIRRGQMAKFVHVLLSSPLVLLEVGMHVSSGKMLSRRRGRAAALEWLLLAGHAGLYLAAVFFVLSPLRAVAFIVIQQGVFGLYLRLCFAPNHKGMPIIAHDTKMEFVTRQVITSRNLTGGWLTTFMLGGLNYQIEHHLFPTMPRPNLAKAQGLIRAFCGENGLEYREDNLFDSYRQAFRFLQTGDAERIPFAGTLPTP